MDKKSINVYKVVQVTFPDSRRCLLLLGGTVTSKNAKTFPTHNDEDILSFVLAQAPIE